jgi:hypothetical protein
LPIPNPLPHALLLLFVHVYILHRSCPVV